MNAIILLLLLALGFCFIEIFAPGGIFAAFAALFVVTASVIGFSEYGVRVGLYILLGGGVVGTLLFFLEMKLILGTGFGLKRFAHLQANTTRLELADIELLAGKSGETVTRMVPGGKISVDGRLYPATSIDGYLPQGTPIVVTQAGPFSIKVSQTKTS
jgi:membrane-bound ClpP family serine protease